jgi:hypothetical protein
LISFFTGGYSGHTNPIIKFFGTSTDYMVARRRFYVCGRIPVSFGKGLNLHKRDEEHSNPFTVPQKPKHPTTQRLGNSFFLSFLSTAYKGEFLARY